MIEFMLALWAEDFEGIETFQSDAQRLAYANGYMRGGGYYGAGKCVAWRVPEDLQEMSERDRAEVDQALARLGGEL